MRAGQREGCGMKDEVIGVRSGRGGHDGGSSCLTGRALGGWGAVRRSAMPPVRPEMECWGARY
jgi:hypothetical protein